VDRWLIERPLTLEAEVPGPSDQLPVTVMPAGVRFFRAGQQIRRVLAVVLSVVLLMPSTDFGAAVIGFFGLC